MKNQLYYLISVLTVVAYFLPLTIVAIRKLWKETPLFLFAIYWALSGLLNLLDKVPGISENALVNIGIVYNMLDMPLVLAIICFTTRVRSIRTLTRIVLPVYLLALCVNPFIQGLNYDALKYLLGFGLLVVFTILIWDVIFHLRKLEHSRREKASLLIDAALLFQYGTYVIIYIFDYFWVDASNETDNYILYYISSIVSLIVACIAYVVVKPSQAKAKAKKTEQEDADGTPKQKPDPLITIY